MTTLGRHEAPQGVESSHTTTGRLKLAPTLDRISARMLQLSATT
eukprot:SAG11_NODE_33054_length_279_cov_0.861111_1_plen_43_part_10